MLSITNTLTKAITQIPIKQALLCAENKPNYVHPTGVERDRLLEIRNQLEKETDEGSVDLSIEDKLAKITICNPHKKNAMTEKMIVDFFDIADYLSSWKGNFILLQGSKHTFCSGFDLETAVKYSHNKEGKLNMALFMQDTCNRIKRLPIPSCSFVEGYAMGGGAEITTSTDFRIMSPSAITRFVHVRLGLCPSWGGGSRLASIIGPKNALRYIGSATPINAETGLKIGYCEDILEENKLHEFYSPFLEYSSDAVNAVKTIISGVQNELITSEIMRIEQDQMNMLFNSKSNKVGLDTCPIAQKYRKRHEQNHSSFEN
ncbi:hypothetical protein WA158_005936 [Blastocystis sp. Blastoise]